MECLLGDAQCGGRGGRQTLICIGRGGIQPREAMLILEMMDILAASEVKDVNETPQEKAFRE